MLNLKEKTFLNLPSDFALPPENDLGNIEYKSHLLNPSSKRLKHLTTQLNWRLHEGEGKAIYKIGVNDNGSLAPLEEFEMEDSLNTLKVTRYLCYGLNGWEPMGYSSLCI